MRNRLLLISGMSELEDNRLMVHYCVSFGALHFMIQFTSVGIKCSTPGRSE